MNDRARWLLPVLSPFLAIAAALLVGAGLIAIAGVSPLKAYSVLFTESLANYYGFSNTLTKTAPLLLASLGILVALKAGQFNIGGEGQIYMGGLGSAIVGLYLHGLPLVIHVPLALLGGFLLGGLLGLHSWLSKSDSRSQRGHHYAAAELHCSKFGELSG